jgi:hypothetical protein
MLILVMSHTTSMFRRLLIALSISGECYLWNCKKFWSRLNPVKRLRSNPRLVFVRQVPYPLIYGKTEFFATFPFLRHFATIWEDDCQIDSHQYSLKARTTGKWSHKILKFRKKKKNDCNKNYKIGKNVHNVNHLTTHDERKKTWKILVLSLWKLL